VANFTKNLVRIICTRAGKIIKQRKRNKKGTFADAGNQIFL